MNHENKRTFLGLLYVMDEMLDKNIFQRDPNNPNNMLIYRTGSATTPKGWYSENICSATSDLFQDEKSMEYVLEEAIKAGIDIEAHFNNANKLLTY